jgi:hypothetical protein
MGPRHRKNWAQGFALKLARRMGAGAALDCEAQADLRVGRLKSTQDPRLGNLRTLVGLRDRGRMASRPPSYTHR